MQKFIKLLIFMLLPMIMTVDCGINKAPIQKAKILIGGGPGTEFCLFEIYSEGTIKITLCSIKSNDIFRDDFVDEVFEKKVIKMSSDNQKYIFDLLDTLTLIESNKGSIEQYEDATEVRAVIGDKLYWSIYSIDVDRTGAPTKNLKKDLLNLTYKLIELSPIKVGGEQNPIPIP